MRPGEGCHVSVPDLPDVVYLERRDSDRTMHFLTRMGARAPANCTSTGKVLLAFAPSAGLENMLADGLVGLTDRSITDSSLLREELERIRRQEFAESSGEMELGTASFAAPIRDGGGRVVAALGVAGPTARMRRLSRARVVEFVLSVNQEITVELFRLRRVRVPLASAFPQNGTPPLE